MKWFCKPNLLLPNEIGYGNLDPEQAHVFFQLVNDRYEVGSMLLTSNRPFCHWSELMGDDASAKAALDRVRHHTHVLSLQVDLYRMKNRLKPGAVDFGQYIFPGIRKSVVSENRENFSDVDKPLESCSTF